MKGIREISMGTEEEIDYPEENWQDFPKEYWDNPQIEPGYNPYQPTLQPEQRYTNQRKITTTIRVEIPENKLKKETEEYYKTYDIEKLKKSVKNIAEKEIDKIIDKKKYIYQYEIIFNPDFGKDGMIAIISLIPQNNNLKLKK